MRIVCTKLLLFFIVDNLPSNNKMYHFLAVWSQIFIFYKDFLLFLFSDEWLFHFLIHPQKPPCKKVHGRAANPCNVVTLGVRIKLHLTGKSQLICELRLVIRLSQILAEMLKRNGRKNNLVNCIYGIIISYKHV